MQPLEKQLRSKLENTIKEARDIAEAGALAALQQLGVGLKEADAHLGEAEKDLRRRLRAHGRQLGDARRPEGTQDVICLMEEVAYEHWHRMLFARFLAENDLLMYPDPDEPVAVSLEECEEMAADEGARNGWELAARYASKMLPQIFRPDSPSFELELPPEYQRKLENLLAGLAVGVFQASDALGWVYQFWQAKRKDEVNASEVKIGARELPAVTQLFTEPYMVSFLLDNSLGAWWVKQLSVGSGQLSVEARQKLETATTEEELREFFGRPGMPLDYLRFIKTDNCELTTDNSSVFSGEHWQPAAGWFDGWPNELRELKTLDPCCGSGHFLVAAFLMLVPMRIEREGLSARKAVDAVLRENLHGLEIDPRCVEIAAFALALTAWRFPDAGGYRPLPKLQVACSGLSISVAKEEWKALPLEGKNLRLAMDWLYDTFAKAPVLGSLIDPSKSDAAKVVDWPVLQDALNHSLKGEQPETQRELGIVAQGLTKAAQLLSSKYHYVMTNVPYLARGKQSEGLKDFCERQYPAGKNDLATVFLDRCLQFCHEGGSTNVVLPQNWLFLGSYKKFREKLLRNDTWNLIARLGPGAFETISGEVVKAILLTLSRGNTASFSLGSESEGVHHLRGLDVSEPRTARAKAEQTLSTEIKSVSQAGQLENPDAMIILEEAANFSLSREYAQPFKGLGTGDDARFRYKFWEVNADSNSYIVYRSAPEKSIPWGAGHSDVLLWEDGLGALANSESAYLRNTDQWSKRGVLFGMMSHLPASIYHGSAWDTTSCALIPKNPDYLAPLWCFVESGIFQKELRIFNQKLSVEVNHFGQVPFDLEHWTKVAEEKYPNGLPKPYSDDPTQWIFHGHPVGSDDPLQVAVARLLGYQWPAELSPRKTQKAQKKDSEENSVSSVPSVDPHSMELSDEAWEKVDLAAGLNHLADEDGIVCIPPVRGEASAADRLLNLLAAAWEQSTGEGPRKTQKAQKKDSEEDSVPSVPSVDQNSFSNYLGKLLTDAEQKDKSLEGWLRDRFFVQHCKRFQHRPFIWHIWDGLRDGFAALVNYHKFDAKALETLIYTYLGDWISRQQQDIRDGVDGAQEKLAAAETLKQRLEAIREGEAPYDIFVRWKPLEEQSIGWNPDLNDGVRLNIRPFMTGPDLKKKGAGILREKPNIHWKKDRGKDVESAPWFHRFQGERINGHHLSREEKEAARKDKAL
ncbi:MAG: N-6 DNA methylase [Verrucomicrobia bacterium]|jgi:hypothetical protein|nr:N-6 DNA methylase [Verrucomicrobiota bacterium]